LFVAISVLGGSAHSGMAAGLTDIDFNDPPLGVFWEDWQEVFLGENKIGYSQTVFSRAADRIYSTNLMSMRLGRGAVAVSMETEQSTVETLSGEPISFSLKLLMGSLPVLMEGEISGDLLRVKTSQAGNLQSNEYAWTKGSLLLWGLTRETLRRGFEAGTKYRLPMFSPEVQLDGPVQTDIKIGEMETFTAGGKTVIGQKVATLMHLGMGSLESISWMDETGRALKTVLPMGGMELTLYASDESTALTDYVPADMFEFTLLDLSGKIPENAAAVTYAVKYLKPLEHSFPWPEYYSQSILKSDASGALIKIVRANHESLPENPGGGAESVDVSLYLGGNTNMNIEDEKLIELAEEAAGQSSGSVEKADRLRQFASRFISQKSLSVGFATASEVALKPVGDCTEHAVFLAALGRIKGLPTRIVVGLAYVANFQGRQNIFGFHMWTQFFLHGRWVDFDAALGESETSPIRIAFYTGALDENSLFDMTLPLMRLMGNLKIEIASISY